MTVHPRLVRSVPFWALIVGSAAAIGGGAYVLVEKLGVMETTITDGTATGVEVYVGQVWAVFGAVLVGAGVVGLALALTVAAARSLVPAATPAARHEVAADETLAHDAASDRASELRHHDAPVTTDEEPAATGHQAPDSGQTPR